MNTIAIKAYNLKLSSYKKENGIIKLYRKTKSNCVFI